MSRRLIAVCAGLLLLVSSDLAAQGCPELVSDWPAADVYSVAAAGDFTYIGGNRELLIADVSDPSAPRVVGDVRLPDDAWAYDIAVSGSHAYVAAFHAGLRVIDVSRPSEPVEVGLIDTPRPVRSIAVSGSFAYVADYGSLRVIDISAPSAPVGVGFVSVPHANDLAVVAGYAYVVNDDSGLRVIDVSTPWAPRQAGSVDTPPARGVAASGGYAYVLGADGAGADLVVLDVSTPSTPVEVGIFSFGSEYTFPIDVATSGGSAYVVFDWQNETSSGSGLRVIDVSTPSAPAGMGAILWGGHHYAWDVAVSGSYAYVAASVAGLRVVDVSTPSEPVEVGLVDVSGEARGVAVSGDHAYVAWGVYDSPQGGLHVIDVSTPAAPVEVGSVHTPGEAWDVAVSGGHAYVAWANRYSPGGGLRVFDVSMPSAPVEVGFIETPERPTDVAVAGGYAYVNSHFPFGIRVIDVRTPTAPVEVGFFDTSHWGHYVDERTGVVVSDGYVYFAAWDAGLYVFRECPAPAPDARESFIPAAAVAAGAQGAFFQTDVEVNNTGTDEAEVTFQWLPRGEDNSEPMESGPIAIAPGQSLRWENVLTEIFGLGPDSLGALKLVASTSSVIGMSRTYNIPAGDAAGTFGQGLPAIRATEMIMGTERWRLLFLSEDIFSRANVGCINGTGENRRISVGLFDDEGSALETRTMDLGPYSNNQINHVFQAYFPVNGYVDVWADDLDSLYYCYGSTLDNSTSDPTTILPQMPSDDMTFIPAAALASGLEGSFFKTDVDLNNVGLTDITYELLWLPRGADNSDPVHSDPFSLAPGAGVRYANVLGEVFGLEPDQAGAVALEASGIDLLAMSRTYNLPSAKVAGTFGQELPGIPADRMIASGVKKRIIFMNENDDVRSNVGCQNAGPDPVTVKIELHNSGGERLGTRTMELPPLSNEQITRVFRNHAPISAGYVDVWTDTEGASIYCYGSVLDNLTSDPTTVLPQ